MGIFAETPKVKKIRENSRPTQNKHTNHVCHPYTICGTNFAKLRKTQPPQRPKHAAVRFFFFVFFGVTQMHAAVPFFVSVTAKQKDVKNP